MTTGIIDEKRLIFPSLAGLYKTFSPASYSFMRFATGAVLIPHGIQKILLGSAANLATVIDKQMGVSYPLIWAYFAIFAESVGAICLAIGLLNLFRRCVVERSSLVDDMDGQIFEGRVANDLQSPMWNVAVVDAGSPGRQFDLLPV
jgi:hypothetical protein